MFTSEDLSLSILCKDIQEVCSSNWLKSQNFWSSLQCLNHRAEENKIQGGNVCFDTSEIQAEKKKLSETVDFCFCMQRHQIYTSGTGQFYDGR